MATEDRQSSHGKGFLGEIAISYWFPLAMFAMGIIPGCNHMYSGHGGLAWLIVPLCFPYVAIRALIKCTTGSAATRAWFRRFYTITIPTYIALSVPLSWAVSASIQNTFGLTVSPWTLLMLMVSPLPWFYFI